MHLFFLLDQNHSDQYTFAKSVEAYICQVSSCNRIRHKGNSRLVLCKFISVPFESWKSELSYLAEIKSSMEVMVVSFNTSEITCTVYSQCLIYEGKPWNLLVIFKHATFTEHLNGAYTLNPHSVCWLLADLVF